MYSLLIMWFTVFSATHPSPPNLSLFFSPYSLKIGQQRTTSAIFISYAVRLMIDATVSKTAMLSTKYIWNFDSMQYILQTHPLWVSLRSASLQAHLIFAFCLPKMEVTGEPRNQKSDSSLCLLLSQFILFSRTLWTLMRIFQHKQTTKKSPDFVMKEYTTPLIPWIKHSTVSMAILSQSQNNLIKSII